LYELSAQGDFILFDTAPLLEYADTLELLQHMDGVILVAEARSNVEDVQRCVELLEHFEVKRLGVVLNKVPKGV
jgi:Mrp family chromosome partitioning ATPase